jgi:flagellar assembly factor FliW
MEAAKGPRNTQTPMTSATETFLPTALTEPMQITLPFGLIGLGDMREFDLQPIEGSWPFLTFRSRGDLEIEFLAVEAKNVFTDYSVVLSDEDAQALNLSSPEDAMILNIVTVHSMRPQFVTANLAGPIVVNRQTLLGKQVVLLQGEKISTVHPLIDERPAHLALPLPE